VGTVSEAAPPGEVRLAQNQPVDSSKTDDPEQPAASFDPFDDVTVTAGISEPNPAGADQTSTEENGTDPFAPADSSAPGAEGVGQFGFDDQVEPAADSAQWQLHILRLRYVKAHEFSNITESLFDDHYKGARQLTIESEPKTNSVVIRASAAHIEQVIRLAEQLDQPALHRDEDAASEFFETTELLGDFKPDTNSGWEMELQAKDHAHELRDQIAMHDRESHEIAREIRNLKERYVPQPAKVAEGHETLTALLERSFQMRLELQELEVAILRNKLAEIESRVERRSQLRQQIINGRIAELLGEKDDLSWDTAQTPPTRSPFGNPEDERLLIPVESALVKPLPTETTPREPLREGAPELDELRSAPSPKNGFILQQHELIAAEYAVTGAQLRVLHAAKMKNSEANLQTMERHALDYELAVLELERAERLHEELLRHIEASRDSLRLEIRYRQASVELAAAEYQQGVEVNKRLRGTVPEHELRTLQLVLEKAKLSLEQANAELRMLGTQTNGIGKSRSGARKIKPETKVQFEPPAESDLLPVPSKQIDDLDSLPETKTIELPASDKREKVSKPDELPAPSLRKPQPAVEADAL